MDTAAQKNNNALVMGALVIGGGYLVYKFVLKPRVIEPLQTKHYVMALRVNLPAVRFKGDNVDFDLYIQNPNSTPLVIKAIVGDVFVQSNNGQSLKIGNVTRYGTAIIKPTAETKFTFSIRLKFLSVLKYFQNILAGKISHQVFTFIGSINLNGKVIPIKESYKIS